MPVLLSKPTGWKPVPRNPFAVFAVCVFLVGASCVARADVPSTPQSQPQAQDLGAGLSYFRVTDLAQQLSEIRAALEKQPALVLDLRGAAGNNAAAQALRDALASVPAPAKPGPAARVARFVLVNAATAPAIPFALGGGIDEGGVPGVIVIAPASAAAVPADVKAPASADDDKRACDAIAQGAPLYTLINHQPDKPRNDEAALMREQNGGAQQDADTAPAATAVTATANTPVSDVAASAAASTAAPTLPSPPPPLTDSVLQLAVQIHRSLLALKKL